MSLQRFESGRRRHGNTLPGAWKLGEEKTNFANNRFADHEDAAGFTRHVFTGKREPLPASPFWKRVRL